MKRALLTLSAASFALPAFADAGGIDSTVFLAAIFALAMLCRLLCCLVGDAGPAHALDGCDERHFIRNHCRRARRSCHGRPQLRQLGLQDPRHGRRDPRQREHLRRLPRHPAHAGHVQEEGGLRHGLLPNHLGAAALSRCRHPLHPGPARPFQPSHQPRGQPQWHDRHGHRCGDHAGPRLEPA